MVRLVMVNVVLPCFCEEGSIDCSKIVQRALQAIPQRQCLQSRALMAWLMLALIHGLLAGTIGEDTVM